MTLDWNERAAWNRHRQPFDRLRAHDDGRKIVVMELEPDVPWDELRDEWLDLPAHPNLIDAIQAYGDHGLALRYAAIDWSFNSGLVTEAQLATWGLHLIEVFSLILDNVKEKKRGYFLRPFVEVDIGGQPRVGFLPLTSRSSVLRRLPPDLRKHWPRCGEATFVYCVGELLRVLSPNTMAGSAAGCLSAIPESRFSRFEHVRSTLRNEGGVANATRTGEVLKTWNWCEEGMGWYLLRDYEQAHLCFRAASASSAYSSLWSWGMHATADRLHVRPDDVPAVVVAKRAPEWKPHKMQLGSGSETWTEAEPRALECEARRDFATALAIYQRVKPDVRTNRELFTARGRCALHLGNAAEAIECAQRALHLDALYAPALEVLVGAMLARYWHQEALRNAQRLVERTPQSARAHYLLGKALFVNGRIPEAGDAFARATELDPKLLEAQLLLREVHRVTGNVRKSVGSQHAPTFDVPEQLAELRDVLVSGDTAAAITALRDERYARDADAQLLLARFLAFDRRLDEAIAVYDQLAATSHRTVALVGKATALLDLGRAGDALSIFEQLPDDADAAEGQARALEALGRVDEAAEAYRRFIALASSGSDLRVRAAELWLAERTGQR